MKNLNIRPYFDDYSEDKQFYQILFRPAYAIQARELNQLQSILQEQIARHGKNIFKEGSMVIPGQLSLDTSLDFIKLDATYNTSTVDTYLDAFSGEDVEIVGGTSGVRAKVLVSKKSTDSTPPTLWIKYISSGNSASTGVVKKFQPGEIIYTNDSVPVYASVQSSESAIGLGSSANIQKGVYFVNGRFVLVKEQTIILDPYTNKPSYRVGLQVVEDFISPEEDSSLYDNAQGSTNYAAPGAHRYFIDLNLTKYEIDDTSDKSFIELLRVNDGAVESKVVRTEYSILEDSLARRTYDESGNYVVSDFNYHVREHRNNDRGAWTASTQYSVNDVVSSGGSYYRCETAGISGLTPPTHTVGSASNGGAVFTHEKNPPFNQGIYSADTGGDSKAMAVQVEPGKAYVYGYEIEKNGTSTVKIDKATDVKSVRNATIQTSVGSYVVVDNVYGFLDVAKFPTVSLRDRFTGTPGTAAGTEVGTARARYIEYDTGTIGNSACKYILSLFDIKMNDGYLFDSNVHQIYFDNTSGVDFTCDIAKSLDILTGLFSTTNASSTVVGNGTKFTTELKPGDALFHYDNGSLHTPPFYVASIASDTSLTLTAAASDTNTNIPFYKSRKKLQDASNDALVFKLPTNYTRKVKDIDDEGTTNIAYYVKQTYSGVVSSGNLVISTASSSETFASPQQPDAFHVVSTGNGAVISASIALNGSSNVATITVGAGYNGVTVAVVATIKKTIKERTKTVVRAFSEDIIVQSTATARKVTASKVDGIRLLKVSEFTDSGGTPVAFGSSIPSNAIEVDITNRYTFDNGCRDAFYDFVSITNTSGIAPRSPIRIVYDYHEHSSVGDYFTVDSYQKIIPENYTLSSKQTVNLFDCIDFRPTRTSTGFSSSLVPAIGFGINADYTHFLPRTDKIALSSTGDFVIAKGVSAENPQEPSLPENTMLLYTATIYPSYFDTPAVVIKREDNKRYTMKDIGLLESRLSNVEYYTSLSLLESQTRNLQLFDGNGNLSFKNGFIVDSLTDQRIGDTDSKEYKCSVDVATGKLRPSFSIDNVKLFEKAATNQDRLASGYVLQNGIVTLPYSTAMFANQPFATTTESVTPYIKLNFIGDAKITPSSDEWYESQYRPDVIVNVEGNFGAMVNAFKPFLGTVWNAWQTTWVGASRTIDDSWRQSRTEANADERVRTTSTQVGQVRSGINTYVKAVYSLSTVGDRVVAVDIVPFIRPRAISFYATGLKPNTRVYPFFDQTNIGNWVTGATKITLGSKVGSFDTSTSAGSESDALARSLMSLNNAVSTGLSVGDVIHNGAAGNINAATATAIVRIDEDNAVRVVNIRGTFNIGDTVYGNISGATGVVSAIESSPVLVTNIYGEVAGVFNIPSTNAIRFRTGQRVFALSDSISNGSDYTTKASTVYSASGILQTRERTVVSTRNGVIAQELVTENRTTNIVESRVIDVSYYDPLAQSFKTPVGDGIFIDSVDVYFSGKDRSLPVSFEIREMVNGFPTSKVLPGSRVTLKPSQITVSANSSVATRIKTQYPVYLDGDTEYCFVLISDSPYYRVWVSQVGQDDVITGQRISKQPYLGSLFKSQNASTWTPDQLQDIKFAINRCVFVTGAANVRFANQKIDGVRLETGDIFTKTGSSSIRIRIPNHGIPVGSNVVIGGFTASMNGISAANLNGTRTVTSAEQDFIVVTAGGNANITGNSTFLDSVYVTRHIKYDLMNLISSQIKFPGTTIQHFARGINQSYTMSNDAVELLPNENIDINDTWMIASANNETSFNSGNKSVEVIAQLQSTSDYLSPVLDLDRYSLILVGNRIDNNTSAKNIAGLDDYTISGVSMTFTASTGTISVATTAFANIKVGQVVSVSGASNGANNGSATVIAVNSANNTITLNKTLVNETVSATMTVFNRFFDEISENGSSEAKYPMKPLVLSAPATDLRIFMDVSMMSPASFDLYYRVAANGNSVNGATWKLASPKTEPGYVSSSEEYVPVEYSITNLDPFTTAQIKIVMKSTVSYRVPVFKQIRMIASS